jgi:DNA processing protein
MDGMIEAAALVALLRRGDRPWSAMADEVEAAGSAVEVLRARRPGQGELFESDTDAELSDAKAAIEELQSGGFRLVTLLDDAYPSNLAAVHQRPPILFAAGTLDPEDARSVAVVGTRKPSAAAMEAAQTVAAGLAARGVTVVSGLAAGIDTAAHEAALSRAGRTVAVIGTGIRRTYPLQNAQLQQEIAARGLVLSQFWPEAPPTKQSFLMRNAVMSGYALATVVIEASHRSGARVQARLALQHGRHVFLMRSLLQHDWAREYASRPNTTVIDSADDVLASLDRLMPELAELTWS